MSSSCLGELSLHLFKGEEGNKNCILGQPQSWRTELGSNPVSFLPDRYNWGNMSFQDFLHWLEEGHETLLPSHGPFLSGLVPFTALAPGSTELPESCSPTLSSSVSLETLCCPNKPVRD